MHLCLIKHLSSNSTLTSQQFKVKLNGCTAALTLQVGEGGVR